MPSAIDLFSGAGGLSLGLKKAGWSVKAAVEFDETAASTHALNFPEVEHLTCDVRQIDFTKYSGIDLIAGGPPCQPFPYFLHPQDAAADEAEEEEVGERDRDGVEDVVQ